MFAVDSVAFDFVCAAWHTTPALYTRVGGAAAFLSGCSTHHRDIVWWGTVEAALPLLLLYLMVDADDNYMP